MLALLKGYEGECVSSWWFVVTRMLLAEVQAFWLAGLGHVYPHLLQSEACIQIGCLVHAHDGDVINVVIGHVEVGSSGLEVVVQTNVS